MPDENSSRRHVVGRRVPIWAAAGGCLVAAGITAAFLVPTESGRRGPTRVAAPDPGPPARLTGALVSFNGCPDYLTYVKARAEAAVSSQLLPTVANGPVRYAVAGPADVGATGTTSAGAAPMASAGLSQSAGPAPTGSYSQTDDQVAGVDEPDTVKTDGRLVVTLTDGTLRVLDTRATVLGSLQLAGDTGGGLLLSGTRVLVLSSTGTAGTGTTSLPAGGYDPAYHPDEAAVLTPSAAQVAVVDLTDPAHPQLVRTFHFDGSIVAARLTGGEVRLVLRSDGPRLGLGYSSYQTDPSTVAATDRRLIAGSSLADWLPAWQVESPDGATTARQPVTACAAVAHPDQASGDSTVTVLSLDPGSDTPGPGTSVVAAGTTVYATADHIYVAGPAAGTDGQVPAGQQTGCCTVAPPTGATTRIYAFDTPASGAATFAGAGSVPGWLVNSYAMDEDPSGRLRVASTWSAAGTSQSQITILATAGGRLSTVGSVTGLGQGEFIRAVRFIGDRAYIVTFRTFDPLYIVDLSNPSHPELTGELDQPGFSEFLYPLPDDRLLGVGVQLIANEPSGLLVATYDVSNPSHPRRIDESVLAQGFYAQSYDPHAFLYWPSVQLALLALPGDQYGPAGTGTGVSAYQIGTGGQLSRTATLDHGSEVATRSLVIGDQVWVITADGVVTSNLTDLPATTWHSY
jgi:uncharacterized secreted protein with C-terminal beta-propeller domain